PDVRGASRDGQPEHQEGGRLPVACGGAGLARARQRAVGRRLIAAPALGGGPERRAMLYMIVERFKNGDPVPVYRRFRDEGRRLPEGLTYVASWVTTDMTACYQLMECEERPLLEQWVAAGSDLVDFEVFPIITSAEAVQRIAPRL